MATTVVIIGAGSGAAAADHGPKQQQYELNSCQSEHLFRASRLRGAEELRKLHAAVQCGFGYSANQKNPRFADSPTVIVVAIITAIRHCQAEALQSDNFRANGGQHQEVQPAVHLFAITVIVVFAAVATTKTAQEKH